MKLDRYLLNSECILISLTGGTDTDNDITSYFDNTFKAFLNQRVSAFSMKGYNKDYFFYFYAMTKTKSFKEQWLGKGGIQKNTVASDRSKTYLPKIDNLETVNFVSVLTQAIIKKEKLIKERHEAILKAIETELLENQKPNKFSFELPRINELEEITRLDTGLYNINLKRLDFLIKNYSFDFTLLKNLKYKPLRGPNLAVSIIGVTHYSSKRISNKFYKLIQPTDLSEYGTLQTERYFGNINEIKLLKKGDILFGAEGNIGKVYVNIDMEEKSVTNFHGMSITNSNVELYNKCFVACYIKWLRYKDYFKYYSTGGQGGSFGVEKTENIIIPNFPEAKQKEIALLYHNAVIKYNADTFTLANFLDKDNEYNQQAGIYELDKTAKLLKEILNQAIDNIVNDREVAVKFE